MTLTLFHHNSSVCAAKVRVALAEKGREWESRLMTLKGDQFAPEYLALNPAAVVPTLVHDDAVIVESNVILEYLDDAFPDPPLRPARPAERARMRLWMEELEQGEKGVHKAISVLTYAIAYRHHLIAEAGSEAPARLLPVIKSNMNPLSREWLTPVVLHGIASDSFRHAMERMYRLCADFDAWLENNAWLAGGTHSLADIAFVPYLIRLELLWVDGLWTDRPHVADWYARLNARASTAEVWDWYHADYVGTLRERGAAHRDETAAMIADLRNAACRSGPDGCGPLGVRAGTR